MKRILTLLILLIGLRSWSATNIVSCDFLSISNAIVAANAGDTVIILPGTCVITNLILCTNGIELSGSGTNQTHLISGASLGQVLNFNSFAYTNNLIIHDLDLIGNVNNSTAFINIGGNGPGKPEKGFFHCYNLQMTNVMYRGMSVGNQDYFGLIEYCSFVTQPGAGSFNPIIVNGNEFLSWSNAIPLGTINNTFVEHCYFLNNANVGGNGFFDGYNGGQCVYRWNVFDGCAETGCHGYDSQVTSMRSQEIYGNIFTNVNQRVNSTACYTSLSRGGLFEVFSNTYYEGLSNDIPSALSPLIQYYRAIPGYYQGFKGYAGIYNTNYYDPGTGIVDYKYTTNWNAGDTVNIGNGPNYILDASLSGTANHVLLGANLNATLTNLMQAINANPTYAGVLFAASTKPSVDFTCTVTNNILYALNRMDGTNAVGTFSTFGYPAAMQEGVGTQYKYSNTNIQFFACYSCSNLVYMHSGGTSNINFGLQDPGGQFTQNGNGVDNMTNLFVLGRDYFNNTLPPYTTFGVHPLSINQSGVQPLQWVIVK